MKLTKRKGFNFFRSYFDVYNELENDKDKVAFIDALLDRQFLGVKPTELKGMAKFAYISQTNSIDSQVKGYEDRMISLNKKIKNYNPWQGGSQGSNEKDLTPPQQEKGKGKEKGQVKVQLSIIERSQDFYKSLTPFLEIYNEELIQKFHLYWTEHGERDKKMRFEKEKSFGISRRLSTWKEKEKSFAKKENNEPKINRQTKEVIESNRNWQ